MIDAAELLTIDLIKTTFLDDYESGAMHRYNFGLEILRDTEIQQIREVVKATSLADF